MLFNSYAKKRLHKKSLKSYNEGVDLLRNNDFEKALPIFKKLYDENFEIEEVLIKLCFIHKELGNYNDSLKYIDEFLALSPNSSRGLNYKCEILARMGCYEKSLELSDRILEMNDGNLNNAKLIKVKSLMELKRFDEALNLLETVRFNEYDEANYDLLLIKGNDYFYLNQYEKSIECYFAALDFVCEDYGLFYNIGNAYAQLNDYENSMIFFDKALELNEGDENLLYNRSIVLYYLERYDEALVSINKALDICCNESYLYNKAGILYMMGSFQESLEIYESLFDDSSQDMDLLEKICRILYELNNFEDVLKYCDIALSIDAKNEDVLFYKVKAFKGLKDYGRALECIDELIDINPGNEEYDNEKRDLLKY